VESATVGFQEQVGLLSWTGKLDRLDCQEQVGLTDLSGRINTHCFVSPGTEVDRTISSRGLFKADFL